MTIFPLMILCIIQLKMCW